MQCSVIAALVWSRPYQPWSVPRGCDQGLDGREEASEAKRCRHMTDAFTSAPRRASTLPIPRLSRRAAFWAVALSFLAVAAFSTAPSSLYGLYERQEHLSSLDITFVYAVYAVGVVGSLLLAGHVSDWYGRRVVLLPA